MGVVSFDAHGHGPLAIAPGGRRLLSAWLKQGHDWLILQGRAGLVLWIFFPKFENNFEADESRVGVHGVFTSRFLPLKKSETSALEKPDLKSALSEFRKKSLGKSRPFPATFLLVPKGPEKFLRFLCF
jgi:hypothetical protein